VNRHLEEALPLEIEYAGASVVSDAELHVLTGPSMLSENLPARPSR